MLTRDWYRQIVYCWCRIYDLYMQSVCETIIFPLNYLKLHFKHVFWSVCLLRFLKYTRTYVCLCIGHMFVCQKYNCKLYFTCMCAYGLIIHITYYFILCMDRTVCSLWGYFAPCSVHLMHVHVWNKALLCISTMWFIIIKSLWDILYGVRTQCQIKEHIMAIIYENTSISGPGGYNVHIGLFTFTEWPNCFWWNPRK